MITIYHVANARSTRSVWLAYELGLDFEIVEMKFTMAALRAPEYLSVSPLGRVPALRDGDLTIFESGAICQYLCETYDDGKLHRPPGHPERAEWLQWVHYAETIAVHSAALVQQQVFIAPDKRSEVVIKLESKRLEKGPRSPRSKSRVAGLRAAEWIFSGRHFRRLQRPSRQHIDRNRQAAQCHRLPQASRQARRLQQSDRNSLDVGCGRAPTAVVRSMTRQ